MHQRRDGVNRAVEDDEVRLVRVLCDAAAHAPHVSVAAAAAAAASRRVTLLLRVPAVCANF